MKEAFEKIKERLKEERDNASLERASWKNQQGVLHNRADARNGAFIDALSIVSEVEAEYINKSTEHINKSSDCSSGWIPCSERLPEDFQSVLCYAESIARSPDTIFVGSQKHGCWFLQSSIGTESFPTQYKVVAWIPLPEPYKPTTD